MEKYVLIRPTHPIRCFKSPIRSEVKLTLATDEIFKVLCQKGIVTELLPDGRKVALDFSNYDKDNSALEEKKEELPPPTPIKLTADGKLPDPVEEKPEQDKDEKPKAPEQDVKKEEKPVVTEEPTKEAKPAKNK